MSHPEAFTTAVGSVAVPRVPSFFFFFFKELNQDPVLKPLTEKACLGWTPGIRTRIVKPCGRHEAAKSIWVHTGLAFHLLFAKFFLIWALMDSWMFLSRAVSPAILTNTQMSKHTVSVAALHPTEPKNTETSEQRREKWVPGVLQSLLTGVPTFGVQVHQVHNEVFSYKYRKKNRLQIYRESSMHQS